MRGGQEKSEGEKKRGTPPKGFSLNTGMQCTGHTGHSALNTHNHLQQPLWYPPASPL